MTETQVLEKVKDLVAEKLSVDPSKIVPEASFRKDLGADSLDTYELVYAIEEELGVTIPDDMANEFETVGDAVKYLSSKKTGKIHINHSSDRIRCKIRRTNIISICAEVPFLEKLYCSPCRSFFPGFCSCCSVRRI